MFRILIAAFFTFGATFSASAAEFSAEEKSELNRMIRAYILDNPQIIVEAMQVLEQRQQEQEQAEDAVRISRLKDQIFDDGHSHVAGNPDGDVVVVEFLDYRCGYCKRAHGGIKSLLEADAGVKLIVKEFPILGPDSTFAARAAMAALRQSGEKYEAFNDAMMTWNGDLGEREVMGLAEDVGLDMDQLASDMNDEDIAADIRENYALARSLNITGTPGFIIGDQIIRGFVPYDALREMVDAAREQG